MKKKTLILLGVILFITTITRYNSNGSKKKIEERFKGFVSLYPINNLMDFYDKDGDRNQDFDENDKGTWIVRTSINRNENDVLETEGMVLRFNKNTKQAFGHFFIKSYSDDGNTNVEYPVYYNELGIHLVEDLEDEELKNKILNFKFLIEHVSFEDGYLQSLPLVDKRFNVNVPLYNLSYRLNNEDENIQRIKQQYAVTQKFQEQPKLRMEGSGSMEWGPLSKRTIRLSFDDYRSIYITESISFRRSEGMRD